MTRRRELRPEDSWRVVEGENDSFDTSILPSLADSSSPPISSGGVPSQPFSQGDISFGSQDSIRDFGVDEGDILREPFRPSLSRASVSATGDPVFRSPDPQFHMPQIDVSTDATGSTRSERTVRGLGIGYSGDQGARRRGFPPPGSPPKQRTSRARHSTAEEEYYRYRRQHRGAPSTFGSQFAGSVPLTLYNVLGWFTGIFALAFRYAQRPLALLLAIYLCFGGLIIAQNMATRSIAASLSPLCRIPGLSMFGLPFCPSLDTIVTPEAGASHVEFDQLMDVQSKFEQVLEKSADGVSLPFEMKRSEMAIRDLRTLIRHSDVSRREELVLEFDGYIDTARQSATDLQKFNTHVGSSVDAIISINRWTSRYIDTLAPSEESTSSLSSTSPFVSWASWLFHPFQPTSDHMFNERMLLDKYIEHTAQVSNRIAALILEAQAVLRLFTQAEDYLNRIYEITTLSSIDAEEQRDSLRSLWNLVGITTHGHARVSRQIALLRQVDDQRTTAVAQVSALILELESIQQGLGDLRDAVAQPELLRYGAGGMAPLPLSVHIATIDLGVERLEDARKRIRAAEDDRVRDALARVGVPDERLLGGQGTRE
ncbi:uncharacterized protein NECHADRAFT_75364 [Fusarium vanettenii 77-13-4]|uniref:Uncharacterized protein n=1 Tax=Fusarium vanettenii (strain ATCC MYA-4622 / CBS 123669 / FGSC 9596 / NRRL 45880 / 77-13-4) TaxID=660122 RepID=C7YIL4_FUSV7|nr:uncharacterized protein NECHADRAFT_75364 [Fusarium vanettenii 77-13-4]EEU48114.1 hypothetical protein NECHADRAFT_75364 [Fusarium vanettenii 77-13-4]